MNSQSSIGAGTPPKSVGEIRRVLKVIESTVPRAALGPFASFAKLPPEWQRLASRDERDVKGRVVSRSAPVSPRVGRRAREVSQLSGQLLLANLFALAVTAAGAPGSAGSQMMVAVGLLVSAGCVASVALKYLEVTRRVAGS